MTPLTLAALARRARITRRALLYQMKIGALVARRVPWRGDRWQWVVDPAEAQHWLTRYTKHARVARTPHLRKVA